MDPTGFAEWATLADALEALDALRDTCERLPFGSLYEAERVNGALVTLGDTLRTISPVGRESAAGTHRYRAARGLDPISEETP